MTGNCVGWVAYGFLKEDPYVYVANAPGLVISCWLNLTAAKLIYQDHARQSFRASMPKLIEQSIRSSIVHASKSSQEHVRGVINESLATPNSSDLVASAITHSDSDNIIDNELPSGTSKFWEQTLDLITLEKAPVAHENMVVAIVAFWTILLALVAFIPMSSVTRLFVVGLVVNINLVFFYGGPLSTMFRVLKAFDSSSIHRPTMIMNTLNGAFWTAYGIAIRDWFIAVPNGLGAVLGAIQIVVCLLFPPKPSKHPKAEDDAFFKNQESSEQKV